MRTAGPTNICDRVCSSPKKNEMKFKKKKKPSRLVSESRDLLLLKEDDLQVGFSGDLHLILNLPAFNLVWSPWLLPWRFLEWTRMLMFFYTPPGSLEQILGSSLSDHRPHPSGWPPPPTPTLPNGMDGCFWLALRTLWDTPDLTLTSKWGKDTLESPSPESWAIKCFQTCNSSFKRERDTKPMV